MIGKLNEPRVRKWLPFVLEKYNIDVYKIIEIGLVINYRISKSFGTSIDGIIVYYDKTEKKMKLAGLEIKSRSGNGSLQTIDSIKRR